MESNKNKGASTSRRNLLKYGLISSVSAIAGVSLKASSDPSDTTNTDPESGEKIRLLTPEGELVEVDKSNINNYPEAYVSPEESRKGIPDRKFVMVIDLSKCKNARACVENCQKAHNLTYFQEFMKIQLIQDNEDSPPYWFPKPCFHCDYPPCVKVCPTGATFKRDDNIVLVDTERCIGCKFCVTSCPYSARQFNWTPNPSFDDESQPYSPETSVPGTLGTVIKCDFCADMNRAGKLPHCVQACPMGVIYFGDRNEDIVTNGAETLRFSQLIEDGAAFRYREDLGTSPNVYYLPPVNRQFPLERGFNVNDEVKARYDRLPYVQEMKKKNKI